MGRNILISQAIKEAIDKGSNINAYGCYLLAQQIENDNIQDNVIIQ